MFSTAVQGSCEGAIGVFPSEDVGDVLEGLRDFLKSFAHADDWLAENPPQLEVLSRFASSETDVSHPPIKTMERCHHAITGSPLVVGSARYGTDMYLLLKYGRIPTVMYGPGNIAQAHVHNEHAELHSVMTCAKVITATLVRWCTLAD